MCDKLGKGYHFSSTQFTNNYIKCDRVQQILEIKPEINFKQRDSGTTQGNYSRTMSQIGG
ncbi:hypothetical protein [Microcoleus sp. S13C4]|uniref:hypothetical protein n=1 Tax=Microcoleus sp. S13C4 TaxID=3055410 RepID=UPI004040A944